MSSEHSEGNMAKAAVPISRREVLLRVTAMLGGAAVVGGQAFLAGCATEGVRGRPQTGALLTSADVELLDEVADTILPDTSTPGAKAAGVGPFIAVMVADAYSPAEQRVFVDGLVRLERQCIAQHGRPFLEATPAERLALAERLDREQFAYTQAAAAGSAAHFFRMIKELTLLGYFTSEIGYTQAMRYIESPGRWDPCVPYAQGDKIWASHA
jgi:hypothetical protein